MLRGMPKGKLAERRHTSKICLTPTSLIHWIVIVNTATECWTFIILINRGISKYFNT